MSVSPGTVVGHTAGVGYRVRYEDDDEEEMDRPDVVKGAHAAVGSRPSCPLITLNPKP
jgi:hypothetical protein